MKKFLLFFTALSFSLFGQSNWMSWGSWYNLSNTPSATSDYHSVYSAGSDFSTNFRFYVVWGDNGAIKYKWSADFGNTWSAIKTISTTENTCGYPVITAKENNITVLYHTIASGGNYEIICQKSTDNGTTWSGMQKISGAASAITPQLYLDNFSNVLYAVWEERPSNNYEVYFSKSTNFGTTWSSPQNISNTAATSRWVQIKSSGGILYCAWIETSTYPLSDIYFIKSTDYGTTWTTPVNITNDARPQNRIYMDIDWFNNVIYIASDDIITFNFDEIYLLKSTNGGTTWSAPVNITNNEGHSNTPCIKADWNVVYFTWSDNTQSAPAYDNSDIFFKWSSDGGVTWRDSINLSANAETSSRPRVCWQIVYPIDKSVLQSMIVYASIVWYDYSTGDSEILARNLDHGINVPVELTSFIAEVVDNSVILKWSTATETNNKGFEVERKFFSDDKTWQTLTFIPGNGTTTEEQQYLFVDKNVSPGKYIYRLKQIDFDGKFEYSREIEIVLGLPDEFILEQNYPNPFNPVTKIKYSIPSAGKVKLAVHDILGNKISVIVDEEKLPGVYESEFNGKDLSSGIYFYRLIMNDKMLVKKFILIK